MRICSHPLDLEFSRSLIYKKTKCKLASFEPLVLARLFWECYTLLLHLKFGESIAYMVYFYIVKYPQQKMQKIFSEEETKFTDPIFWRENKGCWSCFVWSKNDYVFHFKHYNLLIHMVKKFETIPTWFCTTLN